MSGTAQITLSTADFAGMTITAVRTSGSNPPIGSVAHRQYQWCIQGDARHLRMLAAALAEAADKADDPRASL